LNTISRLAGTGLLFLIIFIVGYGLNRSGKPYGLLAFTIHKLVALAVFAFLAATVYHVQRTSSLSMLQMTAIAITAVFFIVAAVTGALLSIDKSMPVMVLRFHQVIPYLIVLSTAFTLYLIMIKSSAIVSTT